MSSFSSLNRSSSGHLQKSVLRQQLRAKRRALTAQQQRSAALNLVQQSRTALNWRSMKNIALYWAADGELNLMPLMHYLNRHNKTLHLPVLQPLKPRLDFRRWQTTSELTANRFGILEPHSAPRIEPWRLDALLVPLVGFDVQGNRLGMGGGFYDRTLAHSQRWPQKPILVGIAHECQKSANIPINSWDIPLDAILTDQCFYPITLR